jgi:CHASE3 domain sensor protein
MRNRFRVVAALLIVAGIAVTLFAVRSFLREREYYLLAYTRVIESQDIVDAVRNALAALDAAEIHAQSYVLTGDTRYSKAYTADALAWRDEIGVLGIIAEHDRALPLIKDFQRTGDRTLNELGAVVSLYDGGSRDKALDSVRKGSGMVYPDQARDIAGKILLADREAVSRSNKMITNGISRRYVPACVAGLFCLTLISAVLLIFETRRPAELRSMNPAGSLPDRA